jgi:hypothetical protein
MRQHPNLVFPMFISKPASLKASIKVYVFSFIVSMSFPIDSHHQHKPEAAVSHLILIPPDFPDLNGIF